MLILIIRLTQQVIQVAFVRLITGHDISHRYMFITIGSIFALIGNHLTYACDLEEAGTVDSVRVAQPLTGAMQAGGKAHAGCDLESRVFWQPTPV